MAAKPYNRNTLKCVGATSRLIFRVYMLQVLAMAGLGIASGLALATLTPLVTTSYLQAM